VSAQKLDSLNYFQRAPALEFMKMISVTISERQEVGSRTTIDKESYSFHTFRRSEGFSTVAICDREYDKLVAHRLIAKIADDFLAGRDQSWKTENVRCSMPELEDLITQFQDPNADTLKQLQVQIDLTKIELLAAIESLMKRGESLDKLVADSEALSSSSKMFYKQVS
jgi:synaptobrevin family protein YKT6